MGVSLSWGVCVFKGMCRGCVSYGYMCHKGMFITTFALGCVCVCHGGVWLCPRDE